MSNDVYLSYYKSNKKAKVLAALSLASVGDIHLIHEKDVDTSDTVYLTAVSPTDDSGLFSLELNSRLYVLRAKNRTEAVLWIGVLQKMKEKGLKQSSSSLSGIDKGPLATRDENKPSAEWSKESRRCWHYICCCFFCCRRRRK